MLIVKFLARRKLLILSLHRLIYVIKLVMVGDNWERGILTLSEE